MASEKLRKWHDRATRYVLRPKDSKLVRYKIKGRPGQRIHDTKISDMSSTGLSFTVADNTAPVVGETIALEFEIPGREKMATFGRVVRVELLDGGNDLWSPAKVAVEYTDLPPKYQKDLTEGIERAVKVQEIEEKTNEILEASWYYITKGWDFSIVFMKVAVVALALYGIGRLIQYWDEKPAASEAAFGDKFRSVEKPEPSSVWGKRNPDDLEKEKPSKPWGSDSGR